jgi:transposase
MWTPAACAELLRESLPYATCLSDAEWAVLAPLLPTPSSTGRPWRWPLRAVLDGILYVLRASRGLWPFLAHCFADRSYRDDRVGSATTITVEIVEPEEGQTGFAVQPRRWVIERTFGWISRCRRLARDHEATASSTLAFIAENWVAKQVSPISSRDP